MEEQYAVQPPPELPARQTEPLPYSSKSLLNKKTILIIFGFILIAGVIFGAYSLGKQNKPLQENIEKRVFCPNPPGIRPEVCTMECIQNPPYICGSNGKSYCNACQACSNKSVSWYITQEKPCQGENFNYRELCGKKYQNFPCTIRQIYKCQDQFLLRSSCADGQDILLDEKGNFIKACGGIAGYSPECKSLIKCSLEDKNNDLCQNY